MVEALFVALVTSLAVIEAVLALGVDASRLAAALTVALAAVLGWRVARGVTARPSWRTALGAVVCAWSVSVWLRLLALAWRRPVYDWDGLYYHLPALHGWVTAGRVTWLDNAPDIPFVNGYPGGVEVFSLAVHALTGTSELVDATNLLLWPLGALALTVIAGRLGAVGPWRWLPAALAAGAPVLVSQSPTCYGDVAFAATVAAGLAACLLFAFAPDLRLRVRTVALGASLGLMLACKGTGAAFALILGTTAVVIASRRESLLALAAGASAAVIAVLVGGGWYLRNLDITGNPLYPIEIRLGGWVLAPGWNLRDFVDANLPAEAAAWPRPLRPLRCWLGAGDLGWLWVAAGLPAAVWTVARRRLLAPGPVLVGVGALLLAVHPSAWEDRHTLWLHAIGLPCVAAALSHLRRPLAITLAAAAGAVAVWQGESTLASERARGWTGEGYVSSWDYYAAGAAAAPGFDRALAADVIARSDWSRVGNLLGGGLCLPLDAREIRHVPTDVDAGAIERLRRAGVTWVLWDRIAAGEPPPAVTTAARERFRHQSGPEIDLEALRLDPVVTPSSPTAPGF